MLALQQNAPASHQNELQSALLVARDGEVVRQVDTP